MKFRQILLILMIALAMPALGQKIDTLNTSYLFNGVTLPDSAQTQVHPDSLYHVLVTPTEANTIQSRSLFMTAGGILADGGGDLTVVIRAFSRAGTINTTVKLGAYRGAEYGWDWYTINTFTADGRAKFALADQSWINEHFEALAIKIEESGAQSTYYGIRFLHYKCKS